MKIIVDNKMKNYHYLAPMSRKWYVYKYMDFEAAILSLKNSTIRFVEPTRWEDPYESRFYTADYSNIVSGAGYPQKFYACCCTFNKSSEAAWNTYSYNNSGLKGRCVQFKLDLRKLRKEFSNYCVGNNCNVYEGIVTYDIPDEDIDKLHYVGCKFYDDYFKNISLDSYLSLFLIKRGAFFYEKELRFFIMPNATINQNTIYPIIQWKNVIKEIIVDEHSSDLEIDILKECCIQAGISIGTTGNGVTLSKCSLHQRRGTNITIGSIMPKK